MLKKRYVLFIVCLLVVQVRGYDGVCDNVDEINELPVGHWCEIAGSKLSEAGVFPEPLPPGNTGGGVPHGIVDYSGAVFDTERNRLLVFGGGHNNYAGNEIYSFDMDTLLWSRIWGPTPNDQIGCTGQYSMQDLWDGMITINDECRDGLAGQCCNGTYDAYFDGNPGSKHTRNAIIYIPEPYDMMFIDPGSSWRMSSAPGLMHQTWYFDMDTSAWSIHHSDMLSFSGLIYDSVTDSVYGKERSTKDYFIYDMSSEEWTHSTNSNHMGYKSTPAFDPDSRKMYSLGDCSLDIYDIDHDSIEELTLEEISGNSEISCAFAPGFEYDPSINKFVAWAGEEENQIEPQNVYVLDPESREIEKRYPYTSNQAIPPESTNIGTYGRFQYVPEYDVFIVMNELHQSVYAYRLSDLSGNEPGYGSTSTMGEMRIESTRYGVAIEWDVVGDVNHNAEAKVQYRTRGSDDWKDALDLMRVDELGFDMMSGSVLYLIPDTDYELKLSYSDPDGGSWIEIADFSTEKEPIHPTGNIYHVSENGDGSGSESDPMSIENAISTAQPGDTYLIHAGDYSGTHYFNREGTSEAYIVWKAAGDGDAMFSNIRIQKSYNWFEGLKIVLDSECKGISCTGDSFSNSPQGIVIKKNMFSGGDMCGTTFHFVRAVPHARDWYIIDNTIIGPYDDLSIQTFGGEGIDMGHHTPYWTGHTIAHNSITQVGDGISYTGGNADIFGNDIFNVADDGIEPDYASSNVRIYDNRITNAKHNAISLQDFENGMPWYVVGNQIMGYNENPLKIRQSHCQFAFYHNTVVNWDHVYVDSMTGFQSWFALYGIQKNNLFIAADGGKMWQFANSNPNWKTDIDYNGFYWGDYPNPFTYQGQHYSNLEEYSSSSGMDINSIMIDKDTCIPDLQISGPTPEPIPIQNLDLENGCGAIDSGVILPNINDDFSGSAPDLGSHERGGKFKNYGPRVTYCPTPQDIFNLMIRYMQGNANLNELLWTFSSWKNCHD